jgi:hypothetical protein
MNKKYLAVKISAMAALIFTVAGFSGYATSANHSPETAQPSSSRLDVLSNNVGTFDDPIATYEGARIVHNVTVNGEKGMRVHANFRVRYGLNVPCMMIAYFYYDDADNTPLKSGNEHYRDKKGNVAATTNFTPAYDPAVYNDLQLFVPYECLNMESGAEVLPCPL